jgi:hypothetical protein
MLAVGVGVATGRLVKGADGGLRAARSESAPGHVWLGVPSNLPAELSTFVGRADDLECGSRLLGESRLVTFTGAGGCGKTRLARQVATRAAERFPGGVWWVELASLADGALVTDRVARSVCRRVRRMPSLIISPTARRSCCWTTASTSSRVSPSSSPRSCAARG